MKNNKNIECKKIFIFKPAFAIFYLFRQRTNAPYGAYLLFFIYLYL
jgi:hypothetical protein